MDELIMALSDYNGIGNKLSKMQNVDLLAYVNNWACNFDEACIAASIIGARHHAIEYSNDMQGFILVKPEDPEGKEQHSITDMTEQVGSCMEDRRTEKNGGSAKDITDKAL